jgi:hypothetical protein
LLIGDRRHHVERDELVRIGPERRRRQAERSSAILQLGQNNENPQKEN